MLFELMTNAKSLLCEIEILVNNTAHNLRKPRGRTEMGNILKFEVKSPSSTSRYLDRRFTNEKYHQYVSELLHVVTRRYERKKLNYHLQSIGEPPIRSGSRQRINRRRNNNNRLSNESNRNRRKGVNNASKNRVPISNESQRNNRNNSRNRDRPHKKHNNRNQNNGNRRQKRIQTTTTTQTPRIFPVV